MATRTRRSVRHCVTDNCQKVDRTSVVVFT